MENSVSVKDILLTFRRRAWIILVIPILLGMASFIYTHFFSSPMYSATTQVLVNQAKVKKSYLYNTNAVQTNTQLVNTYSGMASNPIVLKQAIRMSNFKMTVGQLSGMLTVQATQNNQLLTLNIQSDSPELSVQLVNHVAEALKSRVKKIMGEDNVVILSPASYTSGLSPITASLKKNVLIAVIAGFIISIGLAFLLDYLDDSIKDVHELKQLDLPVLGVVSYSARHGRNRLKNYSNVQSVSK
ncbi:Wzz/FepE/Etk N-terminal domain-containing protein [Sporolactobacillus shoreicorticis]|uniref:YveK family protein n=1 Tax=Sporolactobacillus shoreicorticis TaxID=1923877 RepID=A0ABW5S2U8_9BACL|nr:Wzz/FepE/Etk N-terminal domain-containing protein [Sporolactobacillus shoreicorticis]MCO7124200.1 Wzz/FepE/Etk N-terminal domain-containing protein [Sporolactobacillus shoreicorticis]